MSSLLTLSLALPAAASPHHAAPAADAAKAAAGGATAAAHDAPLQYTRTGKGPAVVFLHGLGGDRAIWAQEMVRLSPKFTVVAIDLPGHGMSPAPPLVSPPPSEAPAGKAGPSTAPLQVDLQKVAMQVAKVIRAEHLGPAVVVGHSLGGQVAAWVPLVDREAVRGVLLVDSFLSPIPMPEAERARLRADLKREPIATLRRFYAPLTTGITQLDRVVASARGVSPAVLLGYLEYAVSNDTLDEKVGEITVPVHLLAGPFVIANNSDAKKVKQSLQAAGYGGIPSLTYDYFPGSKHWLFWDEPERFHDAMDRFLSQVTRPAVSATKSRTRL